MAFGAQLGTIVNLLGVRSRPLLTLAIAAWSVRQAVPPDHGVDIG